MQIVLGITEDTKDLLKGIGKTAVGLGAMGGGLAHYSNFKQDFDAPKAKEFGRAALHGAASGALIGAGAAGMGQGLTHLVNRSRRRKHQKLMQQLGDRFGSKNE